MEGVVKVDGRSVAFRGTCPVRFVCPKCFGEDVRDAYEGPVYHKPCRSWMEPVTVVRDTPPPQQHTPPETAFQRRSDG